MSTQRTFTLNEAQELLPVLQDLLRTAIRAQQRVHDIDAEMQTLISRILLSGGVQLDPIYTSRLKAERERSAQQLEDAVREIGASGAQVKDLETGLLDFPCVFQGRVVLLCWKMGETAIEHWHGVEEGFAGRKPLDPSMYPDASERIH